MMYNEFYLKWESGYLLHLEKFQVNSDLDDPYSGQLVHAIYSYSPKEMYLKAL